MNSSFSYTTFCDGKTAGEELAGAHSLLDARTSLPDN